MKLYRTRLKLAILVSVPALILASCGEAAEDSEQPTAEEDSESASDTDADAEAVSDEEAETDDGSQELVIDGEVIADAELWAAAQEEGGFTMYSTMVEAPQLEVLRIFEEQTGLAPSLIHMPAAGGLYERILSEHASGVLEAGVVQITDPLLAQGLSDEGIYLEHRIEAWDDIGDAYRYDDGVFYAVLQAINVIAYNTNLVEEGDAPTEWQDLLDPKWQGDIGLVHIGAGGSTWSRDLWLRQTYGIEFWEQLAQNEPQILNGAGQTTEELARGEFAVSMNLPHVVGPASADGAPVANSFPTDGAVGYSHYVGLADGGSSPNASKVFMNWYFSMAGQTAIADYAASYPVRQGAPGPLVGEERLPPPSETNIVVPPLEDVIDQALQDEWQADWYSLFGFTP